MAYWNQLLFTRCEGGIAVSRIYRDTHAKHLQATLWVSWYVQNKLCHTDTVALLLWPNPKCLKQLDQTFNRLHWHRFRWPGQDLCIVWLSPYTNRAGHCPAASPLVRMLTTCVSCNHCCYKICFLTHYKGFINFMRDWQLFKFIFVTLTVVCI